jgi:hypothetical protein
MCAVKSLIKKYKKAVAEEKDSKKVFQDLDLSVGDIERQTWNEQELLAITNQGDYLKIYQVQMNKGEDLPLSIFLI